MNWIHVILATFDDDSKNDKIDFKFAVCYPPPSSSSSVYRYKMTIT